MSTTFALSCLLLGSAASATRPGPAELDLRRPGSPGVETADSNLQMLRLDAASACSIQDVLELAAESTELLTVVIYGVGIATTKDAVDCLLNPLGVRPVRLELRRIHTAGATAEALARPSVVELWIQTLFTADLTVTPPRDNLRVLGIGAVADDNTPDWAALASFGGLRSVSLDRMRDRTPELVAALPVSITSLDLSNSGLTNLTPLLHLRALSSLSLSGDRLRAAALNPLGRLSALEELDLSGIDLSDAAVLSLPAGLRSLTISGDQLSAAAIPRLTKLERINVAATNLDVASLAPLLSSPTPRHLLLPRTVTDDGLTALGTQLLTLGLAHAPVTDASIPTLLKQRHLQVLDLSHTQITAQGIAQLTALSELRELSLDGLKLTDADVAALAPLSQLQTLSLADTKVTDDLDLSIFPELRQLNLAGTAVTPAILGPLSMHPLVRDVDLSRTGLGSRWFADLSQRAPWLVGQ